MKFIEFSIKHYSEEKWNCFNDISAPQVVIITSYVKKNFA